MAEMPAITFTLRKEKTAPAFSAKSSGDSLSLDIMDVIGNDWFGNGVTGQAVSDAIKNAASYKSITLNINSPGGDLFEGVAIHNLLKATGKPVNVNVLGLAASAASLVAMAGDTCTMQLGSQMMIHRALAMAAGFSDDMRKMADTLDQVSDSAADLYVARTGLSKDKVLDMMKAETWMSADQAKANGFATAVSKDQAKVSNSFDLSMFRNVPAELKNEAEPEVVVEVETPKEEVEVAFDDTLIKIKQKQVELARRK